MECSRKGCNWKDRKGKEWVVIQYQRKKHYFCDYECLLLWTKLEKGKPQNDKTKNQ